MGVALMVLNQGHSNLLSVMVRNYAIETGRPHWAAPRELLLPPLAVSNDERQRRYNCSAHPAIVTVAVQVPSAERGKYLNLGIGDPDTHQKTHATRRRVGGDTSE